MNFIKKHAIEIIVGLAVLALSSVISYQVNKRPNIGYDGLTAQPFTLVTDGSGSSATTTEWFGDVLPQEDSVYSLGSATKQWLTAFIDSITVYTGLDLGDDVPLNLGDNNDQQLLFETADADANTTLFNAGDVSTTNVAGFLIGDSSALDADLGLFTSSTYPDPFFAVLSSDATKAITFSHDGTDAQTNITSGGLDLYFDFTKTVKIEKNGGDGTKFTSYADFVAGNITAYEFDTANSSGSGSDKIATFSINGSEAFRISATKAITTFGSQFFAGTGTGNFTFSHGGSKAGFEFRAASGGEFLVKPDAGSSGSDTLFEVLAPASTGLTASTETHISHFNGATNAMEWATGALMIQRFNLFDQPTINFAGASTLTAASTVAIDAPVSAGTNATITQTNALSLGSQTTVSADEYELLQLNPNPIADGVGAMTGVIGINYSSMSSVQLGNQTATTDLLAPINIEAVTFSSDTNTRTVTKAAGMVLNAPVAGTNVTFTDVYGLDVETGVSIFRDAIYFTQTDGGEQIDSQADGYMDYTATTGHRFNMATADTDVRLEFVGTTNSGLLEWLEDEDTFKLSDHLTMGTGKFVYNSTTAGITASPTQTQGNGALTSAVNEVSTVANANDTVTLPSVIAPSQSISVTIINNGANTLQIFPASGDDLGAGVDTATTLVSGSNVVFKSYNGTNWEATN